MRIQTDPRLPQDLQQQILRLTQLIRDSAFQLNALSEGQIQAVTNAQTAVPTSGRWNQGDFVANSATTELGSAGSKYIIRGWRCTVAGDFSGTAPTFVQERALTGN